MSAEPPYRVYIDESGDHRYGQVDDLALRYLGLTGVVIRKDRYDAEVRPRLEALKRDHFVYDPDSPPILVRNWIIRRRKWFGVLRDPDRNKQWEAGILAYFRSLRAQVFTVVIDKKVHKERYPVDTWDPYAYSLAVLLNRIRGWLNIVGGQADVLAEARGKVEDDQLQRAYSAMRTVGDSGGTAGEYQMAYPVHRLMMRKKEHNVAGLQVADLVVADQKTVTVLKEGRPVVRPLSPFGKRLNATVSRMVNRYGQYLLE